LMTCSFLYCGGADSGSKNEYEIGQHREGTMAA
jgi:hypothetical protein